MKPLQIAILTVLIVLWNESAGFPLGGDHGPVGKTSLRDNMSAALRKLINRRDRVHGYFVNSEDIFFYAGNTEALNQFLTGFAKLKNTTLKPKNRNQTLESNQNIWLASPART